MFFFSLFKGDATFWRDKVTLTCPRSGNWHNPTAALLQNGTETYEFEFVKKKYYFHCTYRDTDDVDKTYHFYVEGKGESNQSLIFSSVPGCRANTCWTSHLSPAACKDCFEVDGLLFLLIVIVDLIGTSVLMMIIYNYAKKKVPEQRPQRKNDPGC